MRVSSHPHLHPALWKVSLFTVLHAAAQLYATYPQMICIRTARPRHRSVRKLSEWRCMHNPIRTTGKMWLYTHRGYVIVITYSCTIPAPPRASCWKHSEQGRKTFLFGGHYMAGAEKPETSSFSCSKSLTNSAYVPVKVALQTDCGGRKDQVWCRPEDHVHLRLTVLHGFVDLDENGDTHCGCGRMETYIAL